MFNQLTNRDEQLIDDDEIIYFRDIYDHVIRLTDELDNYRELASSTLDVYLTQVNNNLSVIMKRLTGVTVILAGIGAVAGIFGMSEAATAINGGEGSGFWAITAVVVAAARWRLSSCAGSTGSDGRIGRLPRRRVPGRSRGPTAPAPRRAASRGRTSGRRADLVRHPVRPGRPPTARPSTEPRSAAPRAGPRTRRRR